MNEAQAPTMAVALRVFYVIWVAAAVVMLAVFAVTSAYESPDRPEFTSSSGSAEFRAYEDRLDAYEDQSDRYQRNLGILFSLTGITLMGGSIVALRSNLN